MPDIDTVPETISERRLAANRANALLSTGPRTEEGKTKSSLNAVKNGLTGHAILLADEEEAATYRAHSERVYAWWQPVGDREYTLVQSLTDTQWRLNSIPGLESGLYALGRLRGAALFPHEDPAVRQILLSAHVQVAEARALKNLHLQESRLRRRYQRDEQELIDLQKQRWKEEHRQEREAEQKRQEQEEEQRRQEQARKRADRKKAREAARKPEALTESRGFEFSTEVKAGHDRMFSVKELPRTQ